MEADRLTYGKTFHQIATGTIQLDEGMMSCGNDRVELIRVAFHDLTGDRHYIVERRPSEASILFKLDPPDATSDQAGVPLLDEDYLTLSTIHSAKGRCR
jgi:hypothetical protein